MRKVSLIAGFILCMISVICGQPIEDNMPRITGAIALQNATIVTAPGAAPYTGTVLIRDGLITDVKAGSTIPPDAYIIQADSLFVYPAFVDAFSYTGVKNPESEDDRRNRSRPDVDEEGNPSLDDAGITPYQSVRASFDPKDKSIADWREQGFAIAHVVPHGQMLPGMGSVIILSGEEADKMLWKENTSMYSQWSGARGSYPQTLIGVFAKWRELYQNASQLVSHQAIYDEGTFVTRPQYNRAHEALIPVVKNEKPVYFRAPEAKNISRALALQEDLGMDMVIADATEAWYFKDKLKSRSIPLVLSLKLPEDKSEKSKKDGDKNAASSDSVKTTDTTEVVIVDPEKEAFEKRRAESLEQHRQQAGVLAGEGIPFSFGTMSTRTGDFMKNIRLMIENGLDSVQALAALTTQPAKLLGIDKHCGTIAPGKMANMMICTAPLFSEDNTIKYMLVEGALYEYELKEKKKGNSKETLSRISLVEGTWAYLIDSPDQVREGTFTFKKSGEQVTGTITGQDMTDGGNDELENIVIDGKTIAFTFDIELGGQMIELEFDLEVDGDAMDGSVSVAEFGSFKVTGQRTNKPE